jgi:hypothetical protein
VAKIFFFGCISNGQEQRLTCAQGEGATQNPIVPTMLEAQIKKGRSLAEPAEAHS